MLKVEKLDVTGFEAALRGMRNPYDSWDKADTMFADTGVPLYVGPRDRDLIQRLVKGGSEHRKFLRMIHVQADITAPLYWLKQVDTYKVGVTADSCSTMHTIHKKEFVLADFSVEHLTNENAERFLDYLYVLNQAREEYLKTKSKDAWWQLIQMLPESYNQTRTYDFNYENALTMIRQREGHKLDEWHVLNSTLKALPMMNVILEALA